MEYLLIWCIFAVVVAVGARMRGRNGLLWFLLSMIISPLLSLVLLLLAPIVNDAESMAETHVKCPECAEFVLAEARKCKHCGSALVPRAAPARAEPVVISAPDTSRLSPRR